MSSQPVRFHLNPVHQDVFRLESSEPQPRNYRMIRDCSFQELPEEVISKVSDFLGAFYHGRHLICVNKQLNVLLKRDWNEIKDVFLTGYAIRHITPLIHYHGIHSLEISDTSIRDFSVLPTSLRYLSLKGSIDCEFNPVVLANMNHLTELNIEQMRFTENPQPPPETLNTLALKNCIIPNSHFLRALPNITSLTFKDNYAFLGYIDGDIASVPTLLDLRDVQNKQRLLKADLSGTMLNHGSSLSEARSLRILSVSFTDLENINFCHSLRQLTVLDIRHTKISSLAPLQNTKNLQRVFLSNTLVRDLSPLFFSEDLRQLFLNTTKVSSLKPLRYHRQITSLSIAKTAITDLTPIRRWRNLHFLGLFGTQIPRFQIEEIQANNHNLNGYISIR